VTGLLAQSGPRFVVEASMSHTRIALIILTMLALMVLCAVIGVRQLWAIAALAMLCVLWLLVDKLFEGPVLLTVTASAGRYGKHEVPQPTPGPVSERSLRVRPHP
jgi:choline-glycine betaine transporter